MRAKVIAYPLQAQEKEVERLKSILDRTEAAEIKSIGMNFFEGMKNVETMLELPSLIVMHAILHRDALVQGLEVCRKHWEHGLKDGKDIYQLLSEVRSELEEVPLIRDRNVLEVRIKRTVSPIGYMWASLEFERILNLHEQHQKSYFGLVYSSIVWMWTLFEVASGDLWETTLNLAFDPLGKNALKRMTRIDTSSPEDNLKGKYIKIDHLAEFDYDIKKNVGSILKHRFDFSSVTGIRKAYQFIIPRSNTLRKSLADNTLALLAEDRNLIVHKAGYIDSRYKRVTASTQNVGEKLKIDTRYFKQYPVAITRTIGDILSCVNSFLGLSAVHIESSDSSE